MTSPILPTNEPPNKIESEIVDKDKRKRNEVSLNSISPNPSDSKTLSPTKAPLNDTEVTKTEKQGEETKKQDTKPIVPSLFKGKGTSSWEDFDEPKVPVKDNKTESKTTSNTNKDDKPSLSRPIVGIQPSSLGTFSSSESKPPTSVKPSPLSSSTSIFGSSFSGPTFGSSFSSNTPSSFGAAAEKSTNFSDMLKSPLKKKVKLAENGSTKVKQVDNHKEQLDEQDKSESVEEFDPQPPVIVDEWKGKEIKPLEKCNQLLQ